MSELISARIDQQMSRDISLIAKRKKLDKSTMARLLLAKSIDQEKIDYALELYQKGEITIGKAAEFTGKSLREMLLIVSKRGIPFQYSLQDLYDDSRAAAR